MRGLVSAVLTVLVLVLYSCSHSRYEVDTGQVNYNPEFLRLDRAVFSEKARFTKSEIELFRDSFGDFFEIYVSDIMQMPPPGNSMLPEFMNRFTSDPVWQKLNLLIEDTYPELDSQKEEIVRALKKYAVHFDQDSLPRLVAYNSGFNVGIYPSRDWLGVGLEWYIGYDNEVVKQLPPDLFPQYKREKMDPKYMVVNAVKGWLFVNHQDLSGESLLEQMVFRGKVLFITKVLTETDEALVLNFDEEELSWCQSSEYAIWSFLLENDLIFSKDFRETNKILNDGPFTPGMPAESPGGVGNWVGLQMVEAFMDKNGEVTLSELLGIDESRILEYYKPG